MPRAGSLALVGGSYISFIEAGRRRPSLTLLCRLARILDLNRRELFVLAYPDAASLIAYPAPPATESHEAVWRRFVANAYRYSATPAEIRVLREISRLGTISNPNSYRWILNSIRQSLETN